MTGGKEGNGRRLRIALSKGRIYDETLPLFEAAGISPAEDPEQSRKLILPSGEADVEFLIVRASDVPTYVQHGGADLGVVGKDVLMEHGAEGLLEPLDLGIARCRLMVAGFPGTDLNSRRRFRVATKFTDCARRHFARQGRQVEIIKLYGSMELAPLVGLAELIVDVVDTGSTLKANGLVPLEHISDISSRLIVNRASMKIRHARISEIIERIAQGVITRGVASDEN
jgi:ATP phosphoribosyltransferase